MKYPTKAQRTLRGTLCPLILNKHIFNCMTENELATIALDICYKIHTTLGPGLLESVYEAAFAYELDRRGNHLYEAAGNYCKV